MLGCLRIFVAALVLLILAVAYFLGELSRIGVFALPALAVFAVPARLWAVLRRRVHYGFARLSIQPREVAYF